MIQRLQKLFHKETLLGKIILLISFYLIFFFIGYWIWFFIAASSILNYNIFIVDNILPSIYFLLVLPIISFVLIFNINKNNLKIKKIIIFFINLFIVLINLFLFILYGIYSVKPDMFI